MTLPISHTLSDADRRTAQDRRRIAHQIARGVMADHMWMDSSDPAYCADTATMVESLDDDVLLIVVRQAPCGALSSYAQTENRRRIGLEVSGPRVSLEKLEKPALRDTAERLAGKSTGDVEFWHTSAASAGLVRFARIARLELDYRNAIAARMRMHKALSTTATTRRVSLPAFASSMLSTR